MRMNEVAASAAVAVNRKTRAVTNIFIIFPDQIEDLITDAFAMLPRVATNLSNAANLSSFAKPFTYLA